MSTAPLVRAFRALRPTAEHASGIIAPPYDVVSRDEASALAAGRPNSFLHVSRPEIDLAPDAGPYSDAAYARGAENLARLCGLGMLVRDREPSFYLYRIRMHEHEQTGVAVTLSVAGYEAGRVRRHELTRPDKENDRVRNIEALNAQTGPVLCAHRSDERIRALIGEGVGLEPEFSVDGPDSTVHTIWRVGDPSRVAALADAMNALDTVYIADGHHRSAAAARVAAERRTRPGSTPESSHEYFLAVCFADDEMRILDYNRVVADLNGLSPDDFLAAVGKVFDVSRSNGPAHPEARREFGMYLGGVWYRLHPRDKIAAGDPVAGLDVSVLQSRLLAPILGIGDPRTDRRIDFVGGIRGLEALQTRVDSGAAAVAFALNATSMHELMAVADAGLLMPPKSTWFEPKLADGLVSHVLD